MCSMGAPEVPGCSGTPAPGWGYCYMPRKKLKNKKNYHGKGGKSGSNHKSYGMCKGHCEVDSDCKNSLKCFKTNGHAGMQVPGCSGRARQHVNYCVQEVSM